ncbi:pyrimidine dimer DNA glycosylase [candidate division WWE3 bacterium]|uniref:Pyrimidine dimer DNA glycosylase n=1 Tax=candidate division WWE3 bacterium TaxID=2053526 RepID=A0A955LGW3_UNCKA|nr:pyrimidine dimer DNA glycosylase [candidate division WWE3 bacterium]
MQIWDIEPHLLCNFHLQEQHDNIHALIHLLSQDVIYPPHPEVNRWKQKLSLLKEMHDLTAIELSRRGRSHESSIYLNQISQNEHSFQDIFVSTIEEQIILLKEFSCPCFT